MKKIDVVLGIQTWDRRMEGADEPTELWWPPNTYNSSLVKVDQSNLQICKVCATSDSTNLL